MERFFTQKNIQRYRRLADISTDEPQRRLILKFLATQAHSMQTGVNGELTVRVQRRGDKYIWELHRDGHYHSVKFSAPLYLSEQAAKASGNEMRDSLFGTFGSPRALDFDGDFLIKIKLLATPAAHKSFMWQPTDFYRAASISKASSSAGSEIRPRMGR